jgi:very-short-patch-repair endonuclease
VDNAHQAARSRATICGMSLDPRLAGIATSQHGLFTASQALGVGYSEREIKYLARTKEWARLRRGVYIEAHLLPDDDLAQHVVRARAALLCVKDGAFASHSTAAAVHGLAVLDPDLTTVHLTRAGLASPRTEAGIHHHVARVPPGNVIAVGGIPVTDVAWTVVDTSRESSFAHGVVLAESALWREQTTSDSLRSILLTCVDWPGARTAGRVVSFASNRSESPGESLARIAFERLGLPQPRQQVDVHDAFGFIGRVDFLWDQYRTIGEFDGRMKYDGQPSESLYAEKRREDRLREAGFEVVRFGWADVQGEAAELGRRVAAAFARAVRRGVIGA